MVDTPEVDSPPGMSNKKEKKTKIHKSKMQSSAKRKPEKIYEKREMMANGKNEKTFLLHFL